MSLGSYSLGSIALGGDNSPSSLTYFDTSGAVGIAFSVAGVTAQQVTNTNGSVGVALSVSGASQRITNTVGTCNVALAVTASGQRVVSSSGACNIGFSVSLGPNQLITNASGLVTLTFSAASGNPLVVTVAVAPVVLGVFLPYSAMGFRYTTPDGKLYCVKADHITFPASVFTFPRLAPGAGRLRPLVLGCTPPSAPVLASIHYTLDNAIEDLTLTSSVSAGGMLSGSTSIDDLLLAGDVENTTVFLAVGDALGLALDDIILSAVSMTPTSDLTSDLVLDDVLLSSENIASGHPISDYYGLSKWTVLRGTVDLCGMGPNGETDITAGDPRPGNGMYLDMRGTTSVDGTTNGRIKSKKLFSFAAGESYRLSFYCCAYDSSPSFVSMDVSVGEAGEVVSPTTIMRHDDPAGQPFTYSEIVWTQGANAAAPIVFDQNNDGSSGTAGLLLDRVKLENVTLGEEMFYDAFDFENP